MGGGGSWVPPPWGAVRPALSIGQTPPAPGDWSPDSHLAPVVVGLRLSLQLKTVGCSPPVTGRGIGPSFRRGWGSGGPSPGSAYRAPSQADSELTPSPAERCWTEAKATQLTSSGVYAGQDGLLDSSITFGNWRDVASSVSALSASRPEGRGPAAGSLWVQGEAS